MEKVTSNWPNRVSIGRDCVIQQDIYFRIAHPFREHVGIEIGNRVFIGFGCEFNCGQGIKIGDDCLIASHTTFVDVGHEFKVGQLINKQPITSSPIIIEEDVWIGTRCVILQGVTIGRGTVIAAGSLINRSIPEYEVWGGAPARFIRNRN